MPIAEMSPIVHAILALVLLVIATVLGVYKPFGMTPYGSRKRAAERRRAAGASSTGTTR